MNPLSNWRETLPADILSREIKVIGVGGVKGSMLGILRPVGCPLETEFNDNPDARCERGCSCRATLVDLALLSIGFGSFYTCFPGGAAGIGWLLSTGAAWTEALGVQMIAMLATALGTLLFKRLLWEDPSFPHAVVRRIAYIALVLCQAVALAAASLAPSRFVEYLLAVIAGVAMSYPLLAWFEALLIVYRRSGRVRSVVALMLAFIASALLGLLVPLCTGPLGSSVLVVAMLVLSALCLEFVQRPISRYATHGAHGVRGPYRLSTHAIPVLISFGITWGLACCLVVESTSSSDSPICIFVRLAGGGGACMLIIAACMAGLGNRMHFGSIIRSTIVVAGILWVQLPVAIYVTPYSAGFTGTVIFALTGASMTFFSIEIARETGLSIPSVMPVNYFAFVVSACCAALLYGLLRTCIASELSWSSIAASAVIAALVATPSLPSPVSNATMFTLEELPENEGYDDRVERTRANFSAKYGLTEREAEVFELVVKGMTREQIADELSISSWTVKDHVGKIYAKAGVHSAKELMRLVAGADKG